MRLLRHSETPSRTAELVNPFNITGTAPVPMKPYPEKALLQLHGECGHCCIKHEVRQGHLMQVF